MEATKPPESLVERVALGDLATMQAETCSERRAGLETKTAEADRTLISGRPPLREKENDIGTSQFRRGNGVGMYRNGGQTQQGKPRRCGDVKYPRHPRLSAVNTPLVGIAPA